MSLINRREFLVSALALAGHAALPGKNAFAGLTADDRSIKALILRITSITEILQPPKSRGAELWIPLPADDHAQRISGLSVLSKIPYKEKTDAATGNRMFYLRADKLASGDRIILKYTCRRKTAETYEDRDARPERYLEPSEWEKWDSRIAEYTDRLVGKEGDPVRTGRKVYDALIDSMTYMHEACGRGVSSFTFEEKTGRCDEFHALFRSMMMYKKIPVRWEQGIALPYPSVMQRSGEIEADCINAHSWVSFYIGSGRWMPVDVSEAKRRPDLRDFYFGKIVPNRIRMSEGRGLRLNPPQQSTLNTFPYAYIESDGMPLVYSHNYKNVMKYEVVKTET